MITLRVFVVKVLGKLVFNSSVNLPKDSLILVYTSKIKSKNKSSIMFPAKFRLINMH